MAKRGRPRKQLPAGLAAVAAQVAPEMTPQASARREQLVTERRRRRGIGRGGNLKLSIPLEVQNDPNYRYFWALDKPGRIEALTKFDDYDFVTDAGLAGDGRNSGTGTRIERHGDVDKFGNPVRHYLLRKPMEYYKADAAEKQQVNERRMAAIKRGQTEGDDGRPILDEKSYVPKRGISIAHGDYQP